MTVRSIIRRAAKNAAETAAEKLTLPPQDDWRDVNKDIALEIRTAYHDHLNLGSTLLRYSRLKPPKMLDTDLEEAMKNALEAMESVEGEITKLMRVVDEIL